jgi:pimeloyl-ACP methyl ester carboxylesterase
MAAAQRLLDPDRTSPAAKMPGTLVSSRLSAPAASPVRMNPSAAHATASLSHSVHGYAPRKRKRKARFVRHYPEQNPVLRDLLPTITTPTQIVAGRDDDLVPWSNNQYLDDLIPHSRIHPLDAGHFAWEQAADEYGRLVVDWVSGGYRRVEAG